MIPSDNVTEVFSQVTRVNSPFYLSDILIFSILIDVLHYITTGKHYVINKTTGRTSGWGHQCGDAQTWWCASQSRSSL